MVEGGDPAGHSFRGVTRQRGGPRQREGPPSSGDGPPRPNAGRVAGQGARARGQERGGDPLEGVLPRNWCSKQGVPAPPVGGCGVPVAESVLAPPGPIPNPVVTQRSAGEYCGG